MGNRVAWGYMLSANENQYFDMTPSTNSGPLGAFEVNLAQGTVMYFGADSPQLADQPGMSVSNTMLGAFGYGVALDMVAWTPYGYGWNYGNWMNPNNLNQPGPPGAPGTVPNGFYFNGDGVLGTFGNPPGITPPGYVDIFDLTWGPP